MNLKDRLNRLFDRKLTDFYSSIGSISLEETDYGPFVPFIWDDHYSSADAKIVFVGQQTNGWTSLKKSLERQYTSEHLSSMSKDFKHAENYNSPFWNFVHNINKEFNSDRLAFYWTNIFKTESDNYQPGEHILSGSKKHLDTLSEELSILDPDIAVFLTGPLYDDHLKDSLPNIVFRSIDKDVSERKIASVEGLNFRAVRTYHPAYLRRRKIFEPYLKKTIEFLKG
ncbi:hypothetical protein GF336_00545 [Candidatus Woesearchaeota archaeon]|nr:hypothetical protein [Candidatus Woesearchaeota archaeon]